MTTINNHSEYVSLVNTLKVYDYQYFTLNAPTITDAEYDRLYFMAQDYETAHPADVLADSPTQQCYSVNGNGKKTVARRTPCLSMKKIHNSLDMLKYLRRQMQAARVSEAQIDVEWKFDGDTAALIYQRGKLTEATYGHGKELFGNDCLAAISFVQGVPRSVSAWQDIDRVEVRGEVIINNEEYARYTKRGKSQRSTSSGIMAKKYPIASECERLEFHPFRAIMTTEYADYTESHKVAMQVLSAYGFMTSGPVAQFTLTANDSSTEQEIESIVSEAENNRDSLPFPTDGLVFKFDDYTLYDLIGITDHDGKYNCAFKFRPIYKAETIYRGYHTSIGEKAGNITYIADFDEVTLNGARYSTSSCGSEKTFMKKNLTPGDRIIVSIHGDAGAAFIDGKINNQPLSPTLPQMGGSDYLCSEEVVDEPVSEESEAEQSVCEEQPEQPAQCCATSRTMEPEASEEQTLHNPPRPHLTSPLLGEEPMEGAEITPVNEEQPQPLVIEPTINHCVTEPVINHPHTPAAVRAYQHPLPNNGRGQRGGSLDPFADIRPGSTYWTDRLAERERKNERGSTTGKVVAAILTVTALCALGIVAFAGLGAAVFFLPLLGGALLKK